LIGSITLSNAGIGEVVRRTRGRWLVLSDTQAAYEEGIAALGFIVVTDTALGVGATAIPGPVTDANDDGWFVWEPWLGLVGGCAVGGSPSTVAGNNNSNEFDSKAMRRVEEGFSVAVMIENASAAFALDVAMSFSTLSSRIG